MSSPSPPVAESPTASTFLRTAATLDGLARHLEDLQYSEGGSREREDVRCTCGAMAVERNHMEDKLKLSGGM
jgi:hypothetical protein